MIRYSWILILVTNLFSQLHTQNCDSEVCITLNESYFIDDSSGTVVFDIFMENSSDVAGFQFDLLSNDLLTITSVEATGLSGEAGFMMSTSGTTVIAFSLMGTTIPSGSSDILCSITAVYDIENIGQSALLYSEEEGPNGNRFIFSGIGGSMLTASWTPSTWVIGHGLIDDNPPPCDDVDADGICDDEDDCIGVFDECEICNGDGAGYECWDGEFVCSADDCSYQPQDGIYVPSDYLTITEAINSVSDNDTIYVTHGVYIESLNISHSLSLVGYPGVIIDGSGYNSVLSIESDSVLVQGFEIIGDTLTVAGIIVKPGSEHVLIKDNIIHGMKLPNQSSQLPASYGILSYGDGSGPPNPPRNLTIENNEIYDINAFGISLGSFSDSVFIKNNYIHDIDRINLSPYGYDEDLSVGVIAQFGGWIQIEDNDFSNVLLGSNLYFSYGEVSNNTYDDSTKIYLAYNDINPIGIADNSTFPQHASASRFGEFGGISGNVIAYLKNIQDAIDYADNMTIVNVASGIFYENIVVSGKEISLLGQDPMNTILHTRNYDSPLIELDSTNSVIKGFAFASESYGIHSVGNTNIVFEDLLVMGISDSLPLLLFSDSNASLDNVTIVGNAEIAIENSSISISNSIIESEISNTDSSYLEITYSNIYGGYEGEGNIDEDPFFCDPNFNVPYQDFSLAENSPCIGSGSNGQNMGAFGIGCEAYDDEIVGFPIYFSSNLDIAGFQFDLSGAEILGAYGGAADSNGFTISTNESTVIAFSLMGSVVPAGNGILCILEIEGNTEDVCIENLILSGPGGIPLEGSIDDCNEILIEYMMNINDKMVIEEYQISNIFPNPFNPIVNIQYQIPEPNDILISIHDINGNMIEIIKNEYIYPGNYSIQWNGEKFSSGIYFVSIKTESFNKTKKLILVK